MANLRFCFHAPSPLPTTFKTCGTLPLPSIQSKPHKSFIKCESPLTSLRLKIANPREYISKLANALSEKNITRYEKELSCYDGKK